MRTHSGEVLSPISRITATQPAESNLSDSLNRIFGPVFPPPSNQDATNQADRANCLQHIWHQLVRQQTDLTPKQPLLSSTGKEV